MLLGSLGLGRPPGRRADPAAPARGRGDRAACPSRPKRSTCGLRARRAALPVRWSKSSTNAAPTALFTDRAVYGITRPRMVVFRPDRPNGAAALIMPGGGYRWVVIDKEGYEIARWLAARGLTVFVLFYRLPGEGWAAGPDVALADAQRAMRLIRARARYVRHRSRPGGGNGLLRRRARLRRSRDAASPPRSTRPVDAADRLVRHDRIWPRRSIAVQAMSPPLAHPGSRGHAARRRTPPPSASAAHSTARNVTRRYAAARSCSTPRTIRPFRWPTRCAMRDALAPQGSRSTRTCSRSGGHGFGIRRAAGKPAAIWPQLFLDWAGSAAQASPPR